MGLGVADMSKAASSISPMVLVPVLLKLELVRAQPVQSQS